jgi:radical SAM superfamily enzyme YgiQ (UPF0313 family)
VALPVILINGNTVRPPVNPLGLEYVADSLQRHGAEVEILDLSWADDPRAAVARALSDREPLVVGITFRNLDDCSSLTRAGFVPWLCELVGLVRENASCPVVVGGVGYSIAPVPVLERCGADFGVAGDGEETLPLLADRLRRRQPVADLPNLVHRQGGRTTRNPDKPFDLASSPASPRALFDNPRYQAEGAMVGIETKRGCPEPCVYCADPLSKGRFARLRSPDEVTREMVNLAGQGVCWYHLCDSEFNIPISHAKEVCAAIIDGGLQDTVRWYTYCAPVPFDRDLAGLMVRSGCAGINFGVDSLCDEQLRRLGRRYRLSDIETLVGLMRDAGLNFMFDLLLGGPGETPGTVRNTALEARRLDLPLVGVAEGIRVYPGTPVSRVLEKDGADGDAGLVEPTYFFSPALGNEPAAAIRAELADDPRFLLLARPGDDRNYNYVGDTRLCDAIAGGARGAYWDIIRRDFS